MTDLKNNTTKEHISQLLISALIFFASLFVIILLLDASLTIKLILAIFCALIPLFFQNKLLLIYFIFIVTPSLRLISLNEVIIKNYDYTLNFNAIIHFTVIFFGILVIIKNKKRFTEFRKNLKFYPVLGIFLALTAISFFYSITPGKTIEEVIRLLSVVFFSSSCLLLVNSKKTFYRLLNAILLGVIIPSIVGFWQYFTDTGWYDWTMQHNRIQGTMVHPNSFGYYLLSMIPISFALYKDKINEKRKYIYLFLIFILLFLIFATFSRGAWICLLVIIFTYAIIKNRALILIILIASLLAYSFVPMVTERVNDIFDPSVDSSLTGRLNTYKRSLPAFSAAPILGHGFGSFEAINLEYNEEAIYYTFLESHNDYLRMLIELGIVGFVFYVLIFITLLYDLIRTYLKLDKDNYLKIYYLGAILIWICAIIIAMGDNFLRTVPLQYSLWGFACIVIAMNRIEDVKTKNINT